MNEINKAEIWAEIVLASSANFKQEKPSSELYGKIMCKIQNNKVDKISLSRVRTVAAAFICVLSLEVFLIQTNIENTAKFTEIIPENNNTIYYE